MSKKHKIEAKECDPTILKNSWITGKELKKKHKVISLFSGSGGLDLGFIKTGKYEVLLANDFNKEACESYSRNIGDHIIHADIKDIKGLPAADVIIGGPPCQGFSTANPSRSFDDPRNHLFKEYARIIREVKPKVFLLENVSGMATMQKGEVLKLIKNELSNCGYKVKAKILNAKDFGVPQSRRRMIIIGVRNDIKEEYIYPDPQKEKFIRKTVGEAILQTPIKKSDPNHNVSKLSDLNKERIKYIPEGGSMKDCPVHLQNNSDLKRAMRRLDSTKESYTIVHNNCDHYYHPTENRRITIREMARLQGYPDEYVFSGSKSEQSRQVGNSVPVGLAEVLANSIHKYLNKE